MDNTEQYKILLAEDDKFISRAYKDGFQRVGFFVEQAFDGNEALKKARADNFNLILLDLIMPAKDGFETLADLKTDVKLKDIPVIVLSNLGQEGDVERAKGLGAVDYLVKSNFSMKEVVDKIREFVIKRNV